MSTPAPPRLTGALHSAQQQLDELDALIQRMLSMPSAAPDAPALAAEPEEPMATLSLAPPSVPVEVVRPQVPVKTSPPLALAPAPAREAVPDVPAVPESPPFVPAAESPPFVPAAESRPFAVVAESPPFVPADRADDRAPDVEVQASPPPDFEPVPDLPSLEREEANPFVFRTPPTEMPWPLEEGPEVRTPANVFTSRESVPPTDDEEGEIHGIASGVALPTGRQSLLVRCNRTFNRWTYPLGGLGYWLRSNQGRNVIGWTGIALLIGAVGWAILDWLGWT